MHWQVKASSARHARSACKPTVTTLGTPVPPIRWVSTTRMVFVVLAGSGGFGCGPDGSTAPRMDVVVRDRIALDSSFGPPPLVQVRESGSGGFYSTSTTDRGRIYFRSADRRLTKISPPGSAMSVSTIGTRGDSLWVGDDAGRRVLFWDRKRNSWHEVLEPTVQPRGGAALIGVLADGAAIVVSAPESMIADTVTAYVVTVNRRSSVLIDSLIRVHGALAVSTPDGGRASTLTQPWVYYDIPVVARDGGSVTVLRQRPWRTGRNGAVVEAYTRRTSYDGLFADTMPFSTAAITGTDVDRWLEAHLGDSLSQMLGGRARAESLLRASVFVPAFQPAIRRAVGGPKDLLYLERVTADSTHHWEVWRSGRCTGLFHLAPSVELQEVSDSTFTAIDRSTSGNDTLIVATLKARVHSR